MPELWDLYDIDRRPLNRTIQRGEALPEGTYHLAVGIAVFTAPGNSPWSCEAVTAISKESSVSNARSR